MCCYNVIATGSTGNAVIYHDEILIDCGVPFSQIEKYANGLRLVLLTHEHLDHFNYSTIKKLSDNFPLLRFGIGEHMIDLMKGIRNVDLMKACKIYDYKLFKISPVTLFHDCPNFGYRIVKNGHKIIHLTDTAHVVGIEAKNYDLYAIEHNYDSETIEYKIKEFEGKGHFSHKRRAVNTHLSEQQVKEFIYKNKGEKFEVLRLHESKS